MSDTSNLTYKVVVAEDETIILNNIISKIERTDPRFQVIGRAKNGLEALEMIELVKPSVLFTDIRMPRMDGLELIRRVIESDPHIRIVIISGHDEFEYARQAIRLGVTDYLLKPLKQDALAETLYNIRKSFELVKPTTIFERVTAAMNDRELSISSQSSITDEVYLLLVIQIGHLPYTPNIQKQASLYQDPSLRMMMDVVVSETLGGSNWCLIEQNPFNGVLLAVQVESKSTEKPLFIANMLLNKLCATIASYPVTICSATDKVPLQNLSLAVNDLRTLLEKNIVFGKSQVLDATVPERNVPPTSFDIRIQQQWESLIQSGKKEKMHQELRLLFQEWERKSFPQRWVEMKIRQLIQIFRQYSILLTDHEVARLEEKLLASLFLTCSFEDVFLEVWSTLEMIFTSNEDKGYEGTEELADRIEEYINTHFASPITIKEISAKFNFNPSHLIRIYKRHKNTTPIKYLISLRIREAIQYIINNPEMSFRSIGALVGYPDPDYFSRIFKKETGRSLTEFKVDKIK